MKDYMTAVLSLHCCSDIGANANTLFLLVSRYKLYGKIHNATCQQIKNTCLGATWFRVVYRCGVAMAGMACWTKPS